MKVLKHQNIFWSAYKYIRSIKFSIESATWCLSRLVTPTLEFQKIQKSMTLCEWLLYLNLTGNPPYSGTKGNLVHSYSLRNHSATRTCNFHFIDHDKLFWYERANEQTRSRYYSIHVRILGAWNFKCSIYTAHLNNPHDPVIDTYICPLATW